MKKIVSALLVCFLLVGSMFALVSCGGTKIDNGTYEADDMPMTLKVSGNEMTMLQEEDGTSVEIKFTYEIKADEAEDAKEGAEVIVLTYKDTNIELSDEAEAALTEALEYMGLETIDEYIAQMKEQMEEMYKDEEFTKPHPFEKTENGFIMDEVEFTKQ